LREQTQLKTSRREFLLTAATAATVVPSDAAYVVLRVSDGTVLADSGASASQWALPPGSSVKPFVIEALLQSNKLRDNERFLCQGKLRVNGRNFTCSHPAHLPPFDVGQALAYSCNAAVLHWAQRFGPGELAAALRQNGFHLTAPESPLMALGEDGIAVTPLEAAKAYRRLARSAHPAVLQGLTGAVAYGTAQAAGSSGISVAGKTGSAITTAGLHAAWFGGFAPATSPHVVVVVARQGRSGGSDAAPIAATLFAQFGTDAYRVQVAGRVITLPIEEYVSAVLAGESSIFRHDEALKAMAVAVRTFAAHERGRHSVNGFDFCDTTHCQRANPAAVTPRMREIARVTAGEILRKGGAPAFTPYTRNCGGISESVGAVWPSEGESYLTVHRDPFCKRVFWTHRFSGAEVQRALAQVGLRCPSDLKRVSVASRTSAGRASELRLDGHGSATVSAGAFRFAIGRTLGWNLVRSDWFDVQDDLVFRGQGEGHGVGLCQSGAEEMALSGHSYHDILAFYYRDLQTTNWTRLGGQGVTVLTTAPSNGCNLVLHEAEQLLERLPWPLEAPVNIYVHPSVEAFRNSTHEPGWIAGESSGHRIDLQPVWLLQKNGILRSTLWHELLHVDVETYAHGGLPVWFREGVVDWMAGAHMAQSSPPPVNEDLRQRTDPAKAAAGYRAAQARVAELVERYGETRVLGWVSRGLPEEVKNSNASKPATNNR
jgi:stage II sporulation protein D